MKPSSSRVASRFRTASTVQVEINAEATEKARQRYGGEIAVGKFKSSIPLYRVFDGEELRNMLDTGSISGGDYSVPGERAFGAQWGADKGEVAQWGEQQRGKRLGHELFMAEINGQGRVFAHLSGADGQLQPDSGTVSLDPSFCSTGLGCSTHIDTADVKKWYTVENGTAKATTLGAIEEQSGETGLKPRDLDLYKGGLLTRLPKRLQKALRAEVFTAKAKAQRMSIVEKVRAEREMGIGYDDLMDEAKAGSLIIRSLCQGGDDCEDWSTSFSKAQGEASIGRANGEDSFSVVVALIAHSAAPFHQVSTRPGSGGTAWIESAKVKYVDISIPGGRGMGAWHRIWQPWGAATITFLDGGRVSVR